MEPLLLGRVVLRSTGLDSEPQHRYVAASPPVSVRFTAPILRSLSSIVLRGKALYGTTERDVAVKLLRSCASEARAHRPIELHCCASRLANEPELSRLATVRGVYTAVPAPVAEAKADTRRSDSGRLVLADASGRLEPSLLHEYTQVVIMDLYHESLRSFVSRGATQRPDEATFRTIAADVLGGLLDCAQLGVAHGDPCPKQWLIKHTGRLDLTDYGHAWSTCAGCHSQICPVHSYEQAQTGIARWKEMRSAPVPPEYPPPMAFHAVAGSASPGHRQHAYAPASLASIASPSSLDSGSYSFPGVAVPGMASASSGHPQPSAGHATTQLPPIASASSHAHAASSAHSGCYHVASPGFGHAGAAVEAARRELAGRDTPPDLGSTPTTVTVQSGSAVYLSSASRQYSLRYLHTTSSAEADLTFGGAAAVASSGSTTRDRSQISAERAGDSDADSDDLDDLDDLADLAEGLGELGGAASQHHGAGVWGVVGGAASRGAAVAGRPTAVASSSSSSSSASASAAASASASPSAAPSQAYRHAASSRALQVAAGTGGLRAPSAARLRVAHAALPSLGLATEDAPAHGFSASADAKSGTGTLSGASVTPRNHHDRRHHHHGHGASVSGAVFSSTSAASGITSSTQSSQRSQMTPDGGILAPAALSPPNPTDEAFYLRGKNQYRAPEVALAAKAAARYASQMLAGCHVARPACTCGGHRWLCHTADAWGFAAVMFFVATGFDPPTWSDIQDRQSKGCPTLGKSWLEKEASASGVSSHSLWAVFGEIMGHDGVFDRIPCGLRRLLVGGLCLDSVDRWTLFDMVRDVWLAEAAADRLCHGDVLQLTERARLLGLGKHAF